MKVIAIITVAGHRIQIEDTGILSLRLVEDPPEGNGAVGSQLTAGPSLDIATPVFGTSTTIPVTVTVEEPS